MRGREGEISGVNGNPPVLGIDPSIGSHIKLQLLDITLPLSACSDGLDKKCLPKRMLLQGRYGFPALWEQQPHACCLLRNFLPHRVNPGALSSYWPTELLKKNVQTSSDFELRKAKAVIKWHLLFIDKSVDYLFCLACVFLSDGVGLSRIQF